MKPPQIDFVNMRNYREIGLHFFTVMLIIMVPLFVVPNLSTDLKNYQRETNVLKDTRIDVREYRGKYFQKKVEKTLVILLQDESEIHLSNSQSCWKEIQNKNNVGKKITFYSGNNTADRMNPVQLEIEDKVIYDPSENAKWGYFLVLMTVGLAIYSGNKLRNYLKT